MRRLIAMLGVGGLLLVGCGDGESEESASHAQLSDATVIGHCPSEQVKGKAATFSVRVENTGEEEWPAVFVEWTGFRDVFQDINTPGYVGGRDFTTYRFGPLRAGAARTFELTVSPAKSVNRSDVSFAAWGDEPNAESVPTSEIEIHDCSGPWGDGR